jgi:hypothetical protein
MIGIINIKNNNSINESSDVPSNYINVQKSNTDAIKKVTNYLPDPVPHTTYTIDPTSQKNITDNILNLYATKNLYINYLDDLSNLFIKASTSPILEKDFKLLITSTILPIINAEKKIPNNEERLFQKLSLIEHKSASSYGTNILGISVPSNTAISYSTGTSNASPNATFSAALVHLLATTPQAQTFPKQVVHEITWESVLNGALKDFTLPIDNFEHDNSQPTGQKQIMARLIDEYYPKFDKTLFDQIIIYNPATSWVNTQHLKKTSWERKGDIKDEKKIEIKASSRVCYLPFTKTTLNTKKEFVFGLSSLYGQGIVDPLKTVLYAFVLFASEYIKTTAYKKTGILEQKDYAWLHRWFKPLQELYPQKKHFEGVRLILQNLAKRFAKDLEKQSSDMMNEVLEQRQNAFHKAITQFEYKRLATSLKNKTTVPMHLHSLAEKLKNMKQKLESLKQKLHDIVVNFSTT